MGGGAWGHMGHCFGKVVVSRGKWALFWVNVGGWAIILDGWRWVGHYFGGVGVGGALFWAGSRGWGCVGVGVLFDNPHTSSLKHLGQAVIIF